MSTFQDIKPDPKGIGAIIAGLRLTPGPVRRGCGIPRRRRTPIRQGLVKRIRRGNREFKHFLRIVNPRRRRDYARRAILQHVRSLPFEAELNQSELARRLRITVRTVQRHIVYLEARGMLERLDCRGGRRRGLRLRIHLGRIGNYDPSPRTLLKDQRSASIRWTLPVGFAAQRASNRFQTGPPAKAELRADMQRAAIARNSTKAVRAYVRIVRRTAWNRGHRLRDSMMFAAIAEKLSARIGKAGLREAFLRAVIVRMARAPALPGARGEAAQFIATAEQWFAEWSIERRGRTAAEGGRGPEARPLFKRGPSAR